jgi:hypothetical protein
MDEEIWNTATEIYHILTRNNDMEKHTNSSMILDWRPDRENVFISLYYVNTLHKICKMLQIQFTLSI